MSICVKVMLRHWMHVRKTATVRLFLNYIFALYDLQKRVTHVYCTQGKSLQIHSCIECFIRQQSIFAKKIFLYLEKFFCFFTDCSIRIKRYFYMWDKLLCNCGNAMTFHFILVFSIVSIAFIYFHYIESIFVRGIQLCIPFIRSR